jgi:hypothetical protein
MYRRAARGRPAWPRSGTRTWRKEKGTGRLIVFLAGEVAMREIETLRSVDLLLLL